MDELPPASFFRGRFLGAMTTLKVRGTIVDRPCVQSSVQYLRESWICFDVAAELLSS